MQPHASTDEKYTLCSISTPLQMNFNLLGFVRNRVAPQNLHVEFSKGGPGIAVVLDRQAPLHRFTMVVVGSQPSYLTSTGPLSILHSSVRSCNSSQVVKCTAVRVNKSVQRSESRSNLCR